MIQATATDVEKSRGVDGVDAGSRWWRRPLPSTGTINSEDDHQTRVLSHSGSGLVSNDLMSRSASYLHP